MLCDLYSLKLKKERVFEKSFIAVYDIETGRYGETSEKIPSFNRYKIQHCLVGEKLSFSGINIDEKNPSGWQTSFITINTRSLQKISNYSAIVDGKKIISFYNEDKKVDKDYVLPVFMDEDATGSIHALWTNYVTIDQIAMRKSKQSGAIAAGALTFGIAGGIIAGLATSGINQYAEVPLLWLTYGEDSLTSSILKSELKSKDYSMHVFGGAKINGNLYAICNRSKEADHKRCYPNFDMFKDNKVVTDSAMVKKIRYCYANIIYPWSVYSKDNKNYFLAKYDPDMDIYGDSFVKELKDYLLIIEND